MSGRWAGKGWGKGLVRWRRVNSGASGGTNGLWIGGLGTDDALDDDDEVDDTSVRAAQLAILPIPMGLNGLVVSRYPVALLSTIIFCALGKRVV